MITILDYGSGNLRSVQNTLAEIGAAYQLTDNAQGIEQAEVLLLPGVGHFGQLLRRIDELELRAPLLARIQAGVPFLGICLGMQALFDSSDEAPDLRGFGLLPGKVQRFANDVGRVPHMGWNDLQPVKPSRLLAHLGPASFVYFANSYYCPRSEATAAVTDYGHEFTSVIEQGNVFGVQFHPEKSGPVGLSVVKQFVEIAHAG